MKNQRGQALVEMALILPFLLMLVVGIVEGGVVLNRQIVVVNAAREGARFGAFGADADDIRAQTLLAASQMFEFAEGNTVVAIVHAETDGEGEGFEEWAETVYPEGADAPHVTPLEVLAQLRAEGDAANLSLVIVDVRYDHRSVLGLPLVGALADRIPIGSWTAMRISASGSAGRGPGCCVLPIALDIFSVNWPEGVPMGAPVEDIRVGSGAGQFGWLFWQPDDPGAGSVPVLEANLGDRCNAKAFQDACDGSAGLRAGSWAWGDDGEMAGAEDEMIKLVGSYYPVPIWDEFTSCNSLHSRGECGGCAPGSKVVRVVGFALMEITEVDLSGGKVISARFRGWYDGCE